MTTENYDFTEIAIERGREIYMLRDWLRALRKIGPQYWERSMLDDIDRYLAANTIANVRDMIHDD